MKEGLGDIVSINQSAFVPGRKISDNILLTQELMHNYHRDYGPPRCAFKIDIQKAYGTVDWTFLEIVLKGFGFHPIRPYLWSKIGDGRNTSAWFGKWADGCPLSAYISPRQIVQAGYMLNTKVADVCYKGEWQWPIAWLDLFPVLISLPIVTLSPNKKDANGKDVIFSSSVVWDTLREKREEVPWYKIVWSKHIIPRHAFLMWLIVNRKLKTQDIMIQWHGGRNMNYNLVCCPLCKQGPDSHNHLFIECSVSSQVWFKVRHLANLEYVDSRWDDIYIQLSSRANSNSAKIVIGRLLVAASAYFVWHERNQRLFTNIIRSPEVLADHIAAMVRLKLVTLRLKNTIQVGRFIKAWNLPRELVVFDHT